MANGTQPVGPERHNIMAEMVAQLRPAIFLTIIIMLFTGLVYPGVMTGIAQILFPAQANGSLVTNAQGQVIGSALIGQNFSDPKYFHPRPSAAGQNGYDPTASGGSNLGPTNRQLISNTMTNTMQVRTENTLPADAAIPVDAVTASGSGLDPHISPAYAELQVARVAAARHIPEDQVRRLVAHYTEGRQFFILGEPRVNVLLLNLALDREQSR